MMMMMSPIQEDDIPSDAFSVASPSDEIFSLGSASVRRIVNTLEQVDGGGSDPTDEDDSATFEYDDLEEEAARSSENMVVPKPPLSTSSTRTTPGCDNKRKKSKNKMKILGILKESSGETELGDGMSKESRTGQAEGRKQQCGGCLAWFRRSPPAVQAAMVVSLLLLIVTLVVLVMLFLFYDSEEDEGNALPSYPDDDDDDDFGIAILNGGPSGPSKNASLTAPPVNIVESPVDEPTAEIFDPGSRI